MERKKIEWVDGGGDEFVRGQEIQKIKIKRKGFLVTKKQKKKGRINKEKEKKKNQKKNKLVLENSKNEFSIKHWE